ncbi:hypothetical protein KFZ70_06950 [Tamlana fucoidanivorans]|uniref:TonB C-terminal domain-containing protein n=1 Tax=Allotamlana fucoidanivorans TaxID=2583814 RepID=A0A5C4SME8_9FLAO|nr:hypothetical protein [Tamlana fucoidanivorans]TNJ45253.1 hypothetical protein FGF67_05960 [Tamlana fucoidanivorans]
MKKYLVFIVFFTLYSCENFKVKKTTSEAILKEELKTFNWNDVDAYPSFSVCDSSATKADRITCFQTTIVNQITHHLKNEIIVVTQDIDDTLHLDFEVSTSGKLTLLQAEMDDITREEIPDIETILNESLHGMPKIFPAIKRGQHVKARFSLPVIIQVY